MNHLERKLQRWTEAHIIDSATADRILQFERRGGEGRRWPAILAVSFGTLMLCAGVLLFVAAHWEDLSPTARFTLVITLVLAFHVAASLLGSRVPALGVALHLAGSIALGAGIFLAAQIFNLEEHWPSGVLLWALGTLLAWLILREWPQALLASILIPWWLGAEWDLATEPYMRGWNIAAQGFLLLAIFYLSVPQKENNRHLRSGLIWIGCLALLPFLGDVMWSGHSDYYYYWYGKPQKSLPLLTSAVGYGIAYLPVLALAVITRRKDSSWMFGAAVWVYLLGVLSRHGMPEHNAWIFLWLGLGACGLCLWGVRQHRKLFINYGIAVFALSVVGFYFSEVLDKLGRSMGLILLGVIFLAGGWLLHRLRTGLIAHANAGGER
jgi:uncharacterized membrane protein